MEEKIKSTVQENEALEIKEENAQLLNKEEEVTAVPVKKKRQIALKILTVLAYLAVTATAVSFEISFIIESALLLAKPEIGLEGLAFIILIPALIIVPIASLILYIIPFVMSLIGFGVSFKKTKKGAKRKGRVFFGILIALTIISEVIIIIASAAMILAIKYGQ